jgi:hypothetical protein
MNCKNCGQFLPEEANFCSNCGQATGRPANQVLFKETCTINLLWEEGSGFVPAWFQADVQGQGKAYIASQSERFSIIPGSEFWIDGREGKQAHEKLVANLIADGWQKIGQATGDWWSTLFRRDS